MKHLAAVPLIVCAFLTSGRADEAADAKAEAVSRIETAKPQLARGGYFDAIANLKKAIAADPTSLDAALLLAGAYRDTGEYDKARDVVTPFDKSAAAQTLRAELLL